MDLHDTQLDNNVLLIECRGDNLDASNVREFRDQLQVLIKTHQRVVLDMSAIRFVDSSGLGALIACLRDVHSRKGDLKLCGLNKAVRALFELMRMHRVFNIHETSESAAGSFR
jgi:anti-sigma B factor antagonist